MTARNTLWMCVALAAGILAAFLVVVLGTPTKRAEAAFPGKNGKIAFVRRACEGPRSCHGAPEIFTMKANGDNKTRLTSGGAPAFSPTGRKIAFPGIFTMSANGTDIKRVTKSEITGFDPAWSPDGTKITFASERNGNTDIYVINKDGSGLTRITTSPRVDVEPAWSPDGTRIAFVRITPRFKIYVMKAARESETNIPQRLTTSAPDVEELQPNWSPDGTRIAFSSKQSGDFELYSIRADGSDLIQLTNNFFKNAANPAWSPDGTKIVFSGKTRVPDVHHYAIYVMKATPQSETNSPKQLTGNVMTNNSDPDWQPLR